MDITLTPVAWVRGGRIDPTDDGWDAERCVIELDERIPTDALAGLDAFSHLDVVFHFHLVDEADVTVGARRPRGRADWPEVGIFAQRGKVRPNRIGVSTCVVEAVDGRQVHVRGLDAVDGTPVLDLKPHMRGFAARGEVRQPAWADEIMADYWVAGASERSPAPSPRVRRIDHVQLAMPRGGEATAVDFYEGVLGIPRVPKPANLEVRGGCWFADGELNIHLGVEDDFRPARKAHPALVVDGLAALVGRLVDAGIEVRDAEPLDGIDRVHVDDPFGNRIELMERGPD